MTPDELVAEIGALRLGEMRRDVDVTRARAAIRAVAELRLESESALLRKLLRHSSHEIVAASLDALRAMGETFDLARVGRSELGIVMYAMLLVDGPSETFDRVAPLLEPGHPRRAEALEASMRAIFRDFEWSNADANLVTKRGCLRGARRGVELRRAAAASRKHGSRTQRGRGAICR